VARRTPPRTRATRSRGWNAHIVAILPLDARVFKSSAEEIVVEDQPEPAESNDVGVSLYGDACQQLIEGSPGIDAPGRPILSSRDLAAGVGMLRPWELAALLFSAHEFSENFQQTFMTPAADFCDAAPHETLKATSWTGT
jgi:hypothetical protein